MDTAMTMLFRQKPSIAFCGEILFYYAPRYKLVTYLFNEKSNLMHNLFLVYFVNLYMFRAYLCPSSGGTTVCIQQLVLIIPFRWLSVVLVGLELPIQPGQQTAI